MSIRVFEIPRTGSLKNAFDRVTLHVWEGNPAAKRFYEKCGMKPYYYAMEMDL